MRFGTPAQAPRGRPVLTGTPHRLHPLSGQVRVSQKGLLARDHPPGADLPRCVDLKFTVGNCVIWNLDKGVGPRSEAWQSGQGGSAWGMLGLQSPQGPALPQHHPFMRSEGTFSESHILDSPTRALLGPTHAWAADPQIPARQGVPRSVAHPNILNPPALEDVPPQPCLSH